MEEYQLADQDDDPADNPQAHPSRAPVPPEPESGYDVESAWSAVARASAAQSAQANSAVLAAVIRDLAAPLSDLLTLATLLPQEPDQVQPDSRMVVQLMQRKALLLHHRSENLQSAAALWDGSFSLRLHGIELREVVSAVVQWLTPLVAEKNQRLEVILQDETAAVSADPRRVAQVLINLLVNATEHSSPGSMIGIHAGPRESAVRVSVADRGAGIPQERLPGLFELFHQSLPLMRRGRMPLGLTVARALVEAHGGKMGARNRRGGGARVWFELPAAPAEAAGRAAD